MNFNSQSNRVSTVKLLKEELRSVAQQVKDKAHPDEHQNAALQVLLMPPDQFGMQ